MVKIYTKYLILRFYYFFNLEFTKIYYLIIKEYKINIFIFYIILYKVFHYYSKI